MVRNGKARRRWTAAVAAAAVLLVASAASGQEERETRKPTLHGKHWVAITGKPLAATAGALTFARGGNAVDAACAMLAAAATMWDTLSWGGETQALIFDPRTGKVRAINALGVAPTGATPEYFQSRGMRGPPEYGPLAAVTPGTPGGLLVMLAEFGTLSLAEVLEPAMQMAAGYPMEQSQTVNIEGSKELLVRWESSRRVLLPNLDPQRPQAWAAPLPGEIFEQPELLATLTKLVDAEREALKAGKNRKQAILAAYERFYRGDIARELVASTQAAGGLITMEDLDRWQVYVEDPAVTNYKGIDVYKLNHWVQGPVMLQTLNLLENTDLRSMGYNSARYIHTLYQAMNLAFADRDFYYGDPYVPPVEPIKGLLSKEYARQRFAEINWQQNNPHVRPGDPYPFQGATNPVPRGARALGPARGGAAPCGRRRGRRAAPHARPGVLRWHDVDPSRGCRRLGRVDHAERRLGAGVHRRQHRRRAVAAHAELRAGRPRSILTTCSRRASGRARRCPRAWRCATASRSCRSPCRVATRRIRTCCSSS